VSFWVSLRDTALVARWWLARSIRTRGAIALILVFTLVATGGAWIFTRILLEMERAAAAALHVPSTDKPGAMLDVLKERGDLTEVVQGLIGDPALAEWAMNLPILTIYSFWIALFTVPFLAAAAGAEAISPDIRDRTLRYELVRTGRLELVMGRFAGQALLIAVGLAAASAGVWIVAMIGMVQQPPLLQAVTLAAFLPRLWLWSLPWLGMGVGCSQLRGAVNWCRTLALGAAVGLWIAYGLTKYELAPRVPWLGDLLLPAMPPNWQSSLWGPGVDWVLPGLLLGVMGCVATLLTFPLFARRNA